MKEPELSHNALKGLTLRFGQAYVMEFSPRDFETKVTILLTTDLPLYVDKIMYEVGLIWKHWAIYFIPTIPSGFWFLVLFY